MNFEAEMFIALNSICSHLGTMYLKVERKPHPPRMCLIGLIKYWISLYHFSEANTWNWHSDHYAYLEKCLNVVLSALKLEGLLVTIIMLTIYTSSLDYCGYLSVVVWMRMSLIVSGVWTLGTLLVALFGKVSGVALQEEVCHGGGGQALRVQNLTSLAVHTLCLVLQLKVWALGFLVRPPCLLPWLPTVKDA